MGKILFGLGFVIILLFVIGVIFISAQDQSSKAIQAEVKEVVDEVSDTNVSEAVYDFVLDFVEKRDVLPSEVSKIREVDFDSLPKEVNIENVGDHNLAIYEISYEEDGEKDQVYIISYSVEELKAQGDLIIAHDKRQFLNFGYDGTMVESGFLQTATGVEGSLEKGYVMMREGSITAVSTNLDVEQSNPGQIEIIVYRNGEAIGFGNTLDTSSSGVKKDYDVQSKDVVVFGAGDVISVYARAQGDVSWKDVITMVEITTIS